MGVYCIMNNSIEPLQVFQVVAVCRKTGKPQFASVTAPSQLEKSPDIKEIRQLASGHMILAQNGQQYLVHLSAKAFHPLRRWLKKNTNIKNLRF